MSWPALFEKALSAAFSTPPRLLSHEPIGGGCIHRAFCLHTSQGDFFLKANDVSALDMLRCETQGLSLLEKSHTVRTPRVLACAATPTHAYLLEEYLARAPKQETYAQDLGERLAALHQQSAAHCGLEHDNYIGSLPQVNTPSSDGLSFLIERRLKPQVQSALEAKALSPSLVQAFQTLYARLPELLPEEPPALLHGDLWNGNVCVGSDGFAYLIDPAVHYGPREMDLAFTTLFGGFEDAFYAAYHASYPLLSGWKARLDLYQLYPLLVHVNLFGMSYVPSLQRILSKYIA